LFPVKLVILAIVVVLQPLGRRWFVGGGGESKEREGYPRSRFYGRYDINDIEVTHTCLAI